MPFHHRDVRRSTIGIMDRRTLMRTSRLSEYGLSSEDQAVYRKWRRGVLIFYGAVGLMAIVGVTAFQFASVAVQFAGK
jgi:hypothetical protein